MAVVEVGWNIRAGYVGDTKCTRQTPSIRCAEVPTETCFPSILMAAESVGTDSIQTIWTLRSLEHQMDHHMEHLAHIMGKELGCSEDDPLMLVVPEIWHEQFNVMQTLFRVILESGFTSALYCLRPSVARTLASGKASAVVLDIGHNHATTTAVLDGYALRGTMTSSEVAGSAVTCRLMEMLDKRELESLESVERYHLPSIREWALKDVVNDVKRMICRVRPGRSTLPRKEEEEPLVLRAPDGSLVTVGANARTEPYELLFAPSSGAGKSLPDLLVTCKRCLDPEWQQQAVPHVLCGGTSQTPGLRERLLKEVQQRDSSYFRYEKEGAFNVSEAVDGAWTGASLAADSSSFASLWVTRADMEEEGDSILHRKLFY
ncbi:putative actin [Trypanosoma grayi]|uniref:putative actin n=1 Tax=Trypanosoma grayi TaxID=71804 RepID=UPI0004F42C65|nr:putative actin [Trypanosoma grayi]KEG14266.1 putative actin [Trypanosoma grayi]